jgi:hypothetical protein
VGSHRRSSLPKINLYAILVRRKDRRCAPKLAAVREPDRQDCLSSTSRWVPFALGGEGDDGWTRRRCCLDAKAMLPGHEGGDAWREGDDA